MECSNSTGGTLAKNCIGVPTSPEARIVMITTMQTDSKIRNCSTSVMLTAQMPPATVYTSTNAPKNRISASTAHGVFGNSAGAPIFDTDARW